MNKNDFRKLALQRLEDARVLLARRRYAGAYYLSGYVVECALKVCIARRTKRFDFPPEPNTVRDMYVHDLTKLLKTAGLDSRLKADFRTDKRLQANWTLARDWNEKSRYESWTRQQANDLLGAVSDGKHGVLQWISRHW